MIIIIPFFNPESKRTVQKAVHVTSNNSKMSRKGWPPTTCIKMLPSLPEVGLCKCILCEILQPVQGCSQIYKVFSCVKEAIERGIFIMVYLRYIADILSSVYDVAVLEQFYAGNIKQNIEFSFFSCFFFLNAYF